MKEWLAPRLCIVLVPVIGVAETGGGGGGGVAGGVTRGAIFEPIPLEREAQGKEI
jgi:hypothetical protein